MADEIKNVLVPKIEHSLICVDEQIDKALVELKTSESGASLWALNQIIKNNEIARKTLSPACQDTGLAVFFVDIGQSVLIEGSLEDALNESVETSYKNVCGRMSVADPLSRVNTKTNTPAIIHYRLVKGDRLTISFLAKGAGSENMSALYMLTPSKGREGIITSVVDAVLKAGAKPCPPLVLGVGIGGTSEYAGILAKRALLRPAGEPSKDASIAQLEQVILEKVNDLNIGIQGFGGKNTALSVSIETAKTHIGMLPVAVNLQCHSVRHFTIEI